MFLNEKILDTIYHSSKYQHIKNEPNLQIYYPKLQEIKLNISQEYSKETSFEISRGNSNILMLPYIQYDSASHFNNFFMDFKLYFKVFTSLCINVCIKQNSKVFINSSKQNLISSSINLMNMPPKSTCSIQSNTKQGILDADSTNNATQLQNI